MLGVGDARGGLGVGCWSMEMRVPGDGEGDSSWRLVEAVEVFSGVVIVRLLIRAECRKFGRVVR